MQTRPSLILPLANLTMTPFSCFLLKQEVPVMPLIRKLLVLRTCADQLASVFTDIFNLSLSQSVIPKCFKLTTIVPVPKRSKLACLNDYPLVELTSVIMKCFERLVMKNINTIIPDTLHPLQFAYPLTDPQMKQSQLHFPLPSSTWTGGKMTM